MTIGLYPGLTFTEIYNKIISSIPKQKENFY